MGGVSKSGKHGKISAQPTKLGETIREKAWSLLRSVPAEWYMIAVALLCLYCLETECLGGSALTFALSFALIIAGLCKSRKLPSNERARAEMRLAFLALAGLLVSLALVFLDRKIAGFFGLMAGSLLASLRLAAPSVYLAGEVSALVWADGLSCLSSCLHGLEGIFSSLFNLALVALALFAIGLSYGHFDADEEGNMPLSIVFISMPAVIVLTLVVVYMMDFGAEALRDALWGLVALYLFAVVVIILLAARGKGRKVNRWVLKTWVLVNDILFVATTLATMCDMLYSEKYPCGDTFISDGILLALILVCAVSSLSAFYGRSALMMAELTKPENPEEPH